MFKAKFNFVGMDGSRFYSITKAAFEAAMLATIDACNMKSYTSDGVQKRGSNGELFIFVPGHMESATYGSLQILAKADTWYCLVVKPSCKHAAKKARKRFGVQLID